MNNFSTGKLARAAVVAALYVILTLTPPFSAISYGPVQFRIAECLCVLAFFYGEAVIGLTVGCFIANIFGNGILDMALGTSATLLACSISYFLAKKIKNDVLRFLVCAIFPIVINAFIVPITILPFMPDTGYFVLVLQIFAGQSAVILTAGALLYYAILKYEKKHKTA